MATCQGDIPITTKVDESTRVLIDELAEAEDTSRAEVLRRFLELYHQSEDGNLECPSCMQAVRIRADEVDLAADTPDKSPATDKTGTTDEIETGPNTFPERRNANVDTSSTDFQSQVAELESVIEKHQQKLDFLRRKMTAQEREIADLAQSSASTERIDSLEREIEWISNEMRGVIPRVEALTAVSDLENEGMCPRCGTELTTSEPHVDMEKPADIGCSECGLTVGRKS
ncbi:hypothetical protein [Salinigranum marinum]|uniref:hypothetical protein n=1 Tax=Salinigranum marinum TaxID=1515595 RepID=UPI002989EECC|nr:hypothetical protein [Salinigranum marinum]